MRGFAPGVISTRRSPAKKPGVSLSEEQPPLYDAIEKCSFGMSTLNLKLMRRLPPSSVLPHFVPFLLPLMVPKYRRRCLSSAEAVGQETLGCVGGRRVGGGRGECACSVGVLRVRASRCGAHRSRTGLSCRLPLHPRTQMSAPRPVPHSIAPPPSTHRAARARRLPSP